MSDYTIPAADVVSRDCYDRVLAENDELREQLNAYRATGLSPERVAEYAQADREGRYIVLKEPERAGVERLIEIAQADLEGRLVIRRERLTNADKIRTMTTDEELAYAAHAIRELSR
ncbi:MAG: hypothetical protein IIZ56_04925 [Clostridia bacterium]|nr:hypothetical protein [Clostridia bacterium]